MNGFHDLRIFPGALRSGQLGERLCCDRERSDPKFGRGGPEAGEADEVPGQERSIAALMTIIILSPSAEDCWMKAARLTGSFLSAF